MYANVSKTAYWDKSKADTSIQLGYSTSVGDVSYSLGLAMSKGANTDDRSLSLSISMPLGGTRSRRVTANLNQSARGSASRTATLSGNAFEDDTLAYSAGVSQQVNGVQRQTGGTFAAQYDAPNAIVRGAYNETSGSRQLDMGIEGSVVAYDSNLMFSQPLGETNVIVATPGAADVGISNKRGVRTNSNGYTVVPQALPYRKTACRWTPNRCRPTSTSPSRCRKSRQTVARLYWPTSTLGAANAFCFASATPVA